MPSVCQQSWYINSTNYYPRIEGIIWFLYANVTPNDPCDQGNLIGTNSFPDRIAYHQIIGKTIMCNNDWEDNPVCGSDGITYKNPDKAKCVNISFRYGNCELTTTTTTTTSDTTIPDTTTTTTSTTTTTTTTTTTEETQTTTQTISQPEEISLNTILLSMTAIIIPILLFFMLRRI